MPTRACTRQNLEEEINHMAHTKAQKFHGPPAVSYVELVAILPPRPLHDAIDYDNAVEMMGNLIGYDLNSDQEDYLEALGVFVERYESEHEQTQVDVSQLTGRDLLKHLLEENNMTGADLSRLLGVSRTLGPMILRGERSLTIAHARILGKRFGVEAGMFV
jgi:antitoxin component HigA of HigAB toxin-antitoxin module